MAIQNIINDVKTRVENARKPYREAFKAYVDVQKKALNVVSSGVQSLAKTETNAAKDVFAAARASFDKARKDGVRQVASQPQAYVPESRDRIVSAYKETIDLLVKTGNELGDVVTKGYNNVFNKLTGKAAPKKSGGSTAKKRANGKSSTASKSSGAKKSTASKSSASKSTGARKSTTKRSTTTRKSSTSTSGGSASTGTSSA